MCKTARRLFLILAVIIFSKSIYSQTKTEWFPNGLNIQPFTANFIEPKTGVSYLLGKKHLRLDIGTSHDIYKIEKENSTLSFGADFFTFTRLRNKQEFRFPVETVDYLFGLNSGYKIKCKNVEYGFRFRFSHISAHLVDGKFDNDLYKWVDNRKPIVYSREFLELFPFYKINDLRVYTGFTYLIHTIPKTFGHWILQTGFDYYFNSLIAKNISPFAAYDFKLSKINKFSGNNIIEVGIKFGKYDSSGFSILFSYFSGKSIHGEFYDLNEKYAAFGINLDL